MGKALNDPLLLVGKIFAILLQAIMAIAAAAVAIAIPVILFTQGRIEAEIAKKLPDFTEPFPALAVVTLMAGGVAVLVMMFLFFGKLRRIIATVGEGDPFQPENATRLSTMGWLMLATQLALIPAGLIGMHLARYAEALREAGVEDVHFSMNDGADLTGLLLAIILFILARVFRHGAAMREDLEGTV